MDFKALVDLASERLGGAVIHANDEFFAPKENLLRATEPVFIDGKYTDVGKWMDGWETRRRRTPGHDWCLIRLGVRGVVRGVIVDTRYFRGNFPAQCSIEACAVEGNMSADELLMPRNSWSEILPKAELRGNAKNAFEISVESTATHLRLNIFPDGGVARLRVFGDVVPDWSALSRRGEIDLVAVENGGRVLSCSDMFFGNRQNLIMPGRALGMSDGWETKRRRGPGHDWAILKLGHAGRISRLEVDTSHFRGNFPDSCAIEACIADVDDEAIGSLDWRTLLPQTKLQAHTRHLFESEISGVGPVSHIRLNVFPDGGVSRLRVWGRIDL